MIAVQFTAERTKRVVNSEVPLGSSLRAVLPSARGLPVRTGTGVRLIAACVRVLASGKQPMPFLSHRGQLMAELYRHCGIHGLRRLVLVSMMGCWVLNSDAHTMTPAVIPANTEI